MLRFSFFTFLLCLSLSSSAQFGKFLKEKAKQLEEKSNGTLTLDKAQSFIKTKLEKAKSEYDTTSFNYAVALSDNAGLFEVKERYERQKKFLLSAIEYNEDKELTELQKARNHVDKAEMLYANNRYKLAATTLMLAKTIYESENATSEPYYAKAIANLGLLAHTTGRYGKAQELTEQGLALRKESLGENSRGYIASLSNLALLYKDVGQYNQAEELMNKSIDLHAAVIGKESTGYAIALNNKAMLYQTLGRYKEADPLLEEALKILGQHKGEKSLNYQRLLINQALLYHEMGRLEEAESIYLEALEIKERRGQKSHPDYAHTLNNLASLYMDMGRYGEVENRLKKALEIYKAKFGEDNPATATTMSNLGNLYRFEGKYEEALPLLKKAKSIRQNTLNEQHPDFVQSLEDLAILAWKAGEAQKAAELYGQVLTETMKFVNTYFPPMSEAEKTRYWDMLQPRFERFYSFVNDEYRTIPKLIPAMYNYQLATKGILLNTSNRIKREILNGDDESLKTLYRTWVDQKETLARWYSYSKQELLDESINLDSMQIATNSTEKQLSAKSTVFQENTKENMVDYKDVMRRLQPNEVAIEVVRYRKFDQNFGEKVNYTALILSSNETDPISLVTLTNGDQLEGRYYKYYNNAIHQKIKDDYSYQQYWASMDDQLNGVQKVYFSPDGIYHQLNVNTLRSGSDQFNLNKYDIEVLSNTKSLIANKTGTNPKMTATLIGFPTYGDPDHIAPLPGTATEVNSIDRMLKAQRFSSSKLTKSDASETAIKKIDNPKILHIATHGFFLQDNQLRKEKVFGIHTENALNNPLLRSGLMLANAGAASTSHGIDSNDNGILTAYEAMNLSLQKTDFVVLSACETGLGDVKAGEGVYGLQRAFLVAGAKAVVMSLWKVDDQATQALMTAFYQEWVKTKNLQKSFKLAQQRLKNQYEDPYYWGAFVLING